MSRVTTVAGGGRQHGKSEAVRRFNDSRIREAADYAHTYVAMHGNSADEEYRRALQILEWVKRNPERLRGDLFKGLLK